MKVSTFFILSLVTVHLFGQAFSNEEILRWQQMAAQVEIVRDGWGIAHVYGKTDADAVFGMLYAQCEDDFRRVEMNYIDAIGRMAEIQGESALFHDLRARMFLDSVQAEAIYLKSPPWMKKLLDAFAAGVNFYLYKHPETQPLLIHRFQAWMPLMFSEGSIGGNISAISLNKIRAFYEKGKSFSMSASLDHDDPEPSGSNGFAISPSKSLSGNALLLINPHTSFYFRPEMQVTSEQGLNVYGAPTWGQFFIYQGFNEHCGWMHTSSGADVMDEYLETIQKRDDRYYYQYGKEWKKVQAQRITLPYKDGNQMKQREFTIYRTQHGPVVGESDGKWISVAMMNEPLGALTQSYLRTKAKDYKGFNKISNIRTNSSNNTIFADSKGNIAYWHGNFMPKRNKGFNWESPVDGSNPLTNWQGLHKVGDMVQSLNPASGWIQNCNSTPFTVAGASSPKREEYPAYMAPDAENYRGVNAVRVLSAKKMFDLDTLIAAANDPYLAGFEKLIPDLVAAYDDNGHSDVEIQQAIELLRPWDFKYGVHSVATTIAIVWGEKMQQFAGMQRLGGQSLGPLEFTEILIKNVSAADKLKLLQETLQTLTDDFGKWQIAWGEVNRFQRLTGSIEETYDDNKASTPVGFTSSAWGSLAAYGARSFPGTKKRYGTRGNSFVAVVEFGERLKARSVLSGGVSGHNNSSHFNDQAQLFCSGRFKEVLFYPEEVRKNAERTYKPGQEEKK